MTDRAHSLQLYDLRVRRQQRQILAGVSLSIAPGEVAVVLGPHHSGKTTLMEATLDITAVCSGGEVRLDGRPLRGLPDRLKVFCYQAAEAEPALEARVETLLAAFRDAEDASPQLADECERRLGLLPLRGLRAVALSRVERQRVLLFGTLLSRKPYWLLDDPLGAFDPEERTELAPLLLQGAQRGAGILLTASELLGAEALAQRLFVLDAGRIVAHGSPELLRAQAGLPDDVCLDQVCVALARAGSQPPAQPQRSAGRGRG